MRSHHDQIGPEFLFNFEYGASWVTASHHQFTLGFCAEIFGCYLCELVSGVLLPLMGYWFYRDF